MQKYDFRQETITLALKGIGQTKILIEHSETREDKALATAMQEAFTNLWKKMEDSLHANS